MAFNFPNSPSNGQTAVIGGVTYTWTGSVWDVSSSGGSGGGTGYTGSQGPIGYTGSAGSGGSGSVGYTGSAGAAGPQGPIGYTGSQGASGPAGTSGGQGPIGFTGSQGIQGVAGPQGTVAVGNGIGSYMFVVGSYTYSSGGGSLSVLPYDSIMTQWTPPNPGGTWVWRGGHNDNHQSVNNVGSNGGTLTLYYNNSWPDSATVYASGLVQRIA